MSLSNTQKVLINAENEFTGKVQALQTTSNGDLKVSVVHSGDDDGEASAVNQVKIIQNLSTASGTLGSDGVGKLLADGSGGVASNTEPATAGIIGIKGRLIDVNGVIQTTWKSPAVDNTHHLLTSPKDFPIVDSDGVVTAPNVQIQGRNASGNLRTLLSDDGGKLVVSPNGNDATMTNLHQVHSYGYDQVAGDFKRVHLDASKDNSLNCNLHDEIQITTDGTSRAPLSQLVARTTTSNLRTLLCDNDGNLSVKRTNNSYFLKQTANMGANSINDFPHINLYSISPNKDINTLVFGININRTSVPTAVPIQVLGYNEGDTDDKRYHTVINFNQEVYINIGTFGGNTVWSLRTKPVQAAFQYYYVRVNNGLSTNVIPHITITGSVN